ncbi:MAG: hypothetical protein ACKVIH_13340 [Burkholderiales bacterium]
MLFLKRTPPPVFASAPYTVPDAETLRQQALQRGWRRSQRVAQRRLALRWLLWALPRYVLPAAALLGAVFGLYLLYQHATKPNTTQTPPAAATPASKLITAATADGLPLRLSPQLQTTQPVQGTTADALGSAIDPVANPILKPDNSLNSKEP